MTSTGDCRGGGGKARTKRFKGVENFLKRVAFNLGNSPSQTEVKIISCIPIDVSDLQQKIICLEKELEDSRTYRTEQKRICNTAICANIGPPMYNTGVSCNMLDIDIGTNPMEGFSKNPQEDSQPRKKSNVSFITPRESFEDQARDKPNPSYERHEHTALYDNYIKPFTIGDTKTRWDRKSFFRKKKKFLKEKRPKTQYIYYAQTNNSPFGNVVENVPKRETLVTRSYLAEMIDKQYKPRALGGNLSEISKFSKPICKDIEGPSAGYAYESDMCSCCHGTFHNIDNHMAKNCTFRDSGRIPNTGYYDSTLYDIVPVKEKPIKNKKTMDMPKRKDLKPSYDIKCWPEDVRAKYRTYPVYNPLYLNRVNEFSRSDINYRRSPRMTRKETVLKNMAKRRMQLDRHVDIGSSKSCSVNFGSVYPKAINKTNKMDKRLEGALRKIDAECITNFIINSECQTSTNPPAPILGDEKTEATLYQIKNILQSVLQEVKVTTLTKTNDTIKKDAVVQKGISRGSITGFNGNIQHNLNANIRNSLQGYIPDSLQGNISNNIQGNMPCSLQSHMPGSLQGNSSGNQSKMPGILQNSLQMNYPINVAGSVKDNIPGNMTGSFIGNLQASYPGITKDSLLGTFPGVMPADMNSSRLLNSCTFSPFNTNPYLPSCSKQLNSNQPYYPGFKCFHNFPLVLQPTGRHQCNCYRHSGQEKSEYIKQATTIATNTDTVKEEHSKETEKLIKEIYKSMALNMGVVHKDNSTSEYEPVYDFVSHMEKPTKKDLEKPQPLKEVKKVTNVVQAVSELFRKKDMQISSESPNTTTESRLVSNGVSTRSHLVTTTTTDLEVKLRKDRLEKFLNPSKRGKPDVARQEKRQLQTTGAHNATTTVSDSESSACDTDTGVTFVPHQYKQVTQKATKEKQSLLRKMFHSVKLFKARERKKRDKKDNKVDTQDIEDSPSDSDDYQTIYSQKLETVAKSKPKMYNLPKRRTHSKISHKQAYPRDRSPDKLIRRSPYLEQEYRRHWNEKLMFHDDKHRHSSERPSYSLESPIRREPYYQTYEARPAVIEPRRKTVHTTQPVNARKVVAQNQTKNFSVHANPRLGSNGIAWIKKHKMGIHCGEQWKKLILEG